MNPQEYGYLGTEKFEITSSEFMLFKMALEQGLRLTEVVTYPQVFEYVDQEGKVVKSPSEEDLITGKVNKVPNTEKTFSDENLTVTYNADKITKEMLMAQELLMDLHFRNIESGVAKSIEELKSAKELTLEKEDVR